MIRVGCSGFSYPEWRGPFYPAGLPAGRMLEAYGERLPAVELNHTFQRTPTPQALTTWAEKTPVGFRFAVKGHRALTYSAAAFPKETVARDLHDRLDLLGERLGAVLLQFPPTRQHDPELLDRLLSALALPAAVECRHPSWFEEDVYRVLRRHRAALCVTEGEKWPRAPELALAPFAYVRLRAPRYDDAAVGRWRRRLAELAGHHEEIYCFVRHGPDAPGIAQALDAGG